MQLSNSSLITSVVLVSAVLIIYAFHMNNIFKKSVGIDRSWTFYGLSLMIVGVTLILTIVLVALVVTSKLEKDDRKKKKLSKHIGNISITLIPFAVVMFYCVASYLLAPEDKNIRPQFTPLLDDNNNNKSATSSFSSKIQEKSGPDEMFIQPHVVQDKDGNKIYKIFNYDTNTYDSVPPRQFMLKLQQPFTSNVLNSYPQVTTEDGSVWTFNVSTNKYTRDPYKEGLFNFFKYYLG